MNAQNKFNVNVCGLYFLNPHVTTKFRIWLTFKSDEIFNDYINHHSNSVTNTTHENIWKVQKHCLVLI